MSRKAVLIQNICLGILIWLACLVDLGWSVWTDLRIAPAFLDLAVVAAVLFMKPRWTVFWGGFVGLLVSVIHKEALHTIVPLYATISMLAVLTKPMSHKRATLVATALRSLLILISLRFGKLWLDMFPSTDFISAITVEHLAQVAFSFLISVLLCSLFVALNRKTAWA
jgi:hypothetical protein